MELVPFPTNLTDYYAQRTKDFRKKILWFANFSDVISFMISAKSEI